MQGKTGNILKKALEISGKRITLQQTLKKKGTV